MSYNVQYHAADFQPRIPTRPCNQAGNASSQSSAHRWLPKGGSVIWCRATHWSATEKATGFASPYPLVNIQKTMERSTISMGKSTISMVIFNSELLNYQRVSGCEFSVFLETPVAFRFDTTLSELEAARCFSSASSSLPGFHSPLGSYSTLGTVRSLPDDHPAFSGGYLSFWLVQMLTCLLWCQNMLKT